MLDGCTVRSVVQHRVRAEYPCPCWMGTVGAGSTRTPACSESGVAVGVNHMALDRSTRKAF